MVQLGFGPTLNKMIEIVQDYVLANNITTQWIDDRPGYDWAKSLMARQKLSLKKSGLMQVARKNVTADPFVIYGLYTLLKSEVDQLGLNDHLECIWNCDKSGFPVDPSRWKTVGAIGAKSVCENITVLAVCSAAGEALDPSIVFKGTNLQST